MPAVSSLSRAMGVVQKWLHLEQPQIVEIALATIVANRLPGDSLAIVLLGPSSSGRTELLRGILCHPLTYELGDINIGSFLSLWPDDRRSKTKNIGILERLQKYPDNGNGMTLVSMEFSQIIHANKNFQQQVFSQLRAIICDGRFRRSMATGEKTWEGQLGMLAASTPALEDAVETMGALGSRMLFYRLRVGDRLAIAMRAQQFTGLESTMRLEIGDAFRTAIDSVAWNTKVTADDAIAHKLAVLADVVTQGRSAITRDYRHEVSSEPVAEAPARVVKALFKLGWAMALLRGQNTIDDEIYNLLKELGLCSLPWNRRRVLEILPGKYYSANEVRTATHVNPHRVLDDLRVLDIADCVGSNGHEKWTMTDQFLELWKLL